MNLLSGPVAYQGVAGAYSDIAVKAIFGPDVATLPCPTFEAALTAVREQRAEMAVIPVENSVAGRVADVHDLLPNCGLSIVAEHYQPIHHHLLAVPGAKLEQIQRVQSHIQALTQCRTYLRRHGMTPVAGGDTASAAQYVAKAVDPYLGAIASEEAGRLYGLESLAHDIADRPDNTTRFLVMARETPWPKPGQGLYVTSLIFRVRSVPASLYKALGGFATHGINITRLESYLVDGCFLAAQFYADVEGHPQDPAMVLALEELGFFAQTVRVLGVYAAHDDRRATVSPPPVM
ncbi:MAG: prephenate dehydratase [Alphaproteobacteria bacterium]|nr:MAG: prephenate dehydratase [Alphaproteobacteria bacterium]